jgi:hypothetical protein
VLAELQLPPEVAATLRDLAGYLGDRTT